MRWRVRDRCSRRLCPRLGGERGLANSSGLVRVGDGLRIETLVGAVAVEFLARLGRPDLAIICEATARGWVWDVVSAIDECHCCVNYRLGVDPVQLVCVLK